MDRTYAVRWRESKGTVLLRIYRIPLPYPCQVFEYIDREPAITHQGAVQQEVRGRIEFRNVHFSYPTRPHQPILRVSHTISTVSRNSVQDLSFTVEPGETVALVGPSGSGKSSCIALLENFYLPTAGQVRREIGGDETSIRQVLVDGVALEDYEHHYIHRKVTTLPRTNYRNQNIQVALVGQEPILFARSVHENISYGIDSQSTVTLPRSTVITGVSMDDIVNSAKMANAHDFISDTTNKYETNVGEKGSQMSGNGSRTDFDLP